MKILLNDESFRYDVHSLIKAFYPDEILNYNIINYSLKGVEPDIILNENSLSILIPNGSDYDRFNSKNIFKRKLYNILSQCTGRQLEWGTLTGIRPVKLPSRLLSIGKNDKDILEYLYEEFLLSDKKGRLILDIARRERKLLNDINMNETASIYIGIPFCPSICSYCSFSSYPIVRYRDRVKDYILALKKEMQEIKYKINNKKIVSVYMGGGTPTTLDEYDLKDIISYTKDLFDIDKDIEFTVEAGRPDTITWEKLEILRKLDIIRISINPQSMNDNTLKRIGRAHSSEDTVNAFYMARDAGMEIINCDLIIGLPGEGSDEVKYTLNKMAELSPNNITVHSLAIKRASRLNYEEHYSNTMDDIEQIFEICGNFMDSLGLFPYYLYRQKQISGNMENIGYAEAGCECLYNMLIMGEYHNIYAFGAGAVTKEIDGNNKPIRSPNPKDVNIYIDRILKSSVI